MQIFLVEAQNHEKPEHVEHMGLKGCEAYIFLEERVGTAWFRTVHMQTHR